MTISKKKKFQLYLVLFFFIILVSLFYFSKQNYEKEKTLFLKPISINLLTSVHPNLSWNFKPMKSKITTMPGEVTTVEYMVENIGNKESTGIATFSYFPDQFANYITKINCFCYDAKTLKSEEKDKFILVLLIDPKVTKDSKTKDMKNATIQFTFFDYEKYKDKKS